MSFSVSLSVDATVDRLISGIQGGNISAELIDQYRSSNGRENVVVLVFEKYYMRNSSRASLTVTVEDITGVTRVNPVGSGGGQGFLLRFDWGAKDEFENRVKQLLKDVVR
jgi:hypothetical protein